MILTSFLTWTHFRIYQVLQIALIMNFLLEFQELVIIVYSRFVTLGNLLENFFMNDFLLIHLRIINEISNCFIDNYGCFFEKYYYLNYDFLLFVRFINEPTLN